MLSLCRRYVTNEVDNEVTPHINREAFASAAHGLGFKTQIVCGIYQKFSLCTQQRITWMGTRLSSELEEVKVARKRSGTPPQLRHCRLSNSHFPTRPLVKGQPLPCFTTFEILTDTYWSFPGLTYFSWNFLKIADGTSFINHANFQSMRTDWLYSTTTHSVFFFFSSTSRFLTAAWVSAMFLGGSSYCKRKAYESAFFITIWVGKS